MKRSFALLSVIVILLFASCTEGNGRFRVPEEMLGTWTDSDTHARAEAETIYNMIVTLPDTESVSMENLVRYQGYHFSINEMAPALFVWHPNGETIESYQFSIMNGCLVLDYTSDNTRPKTTTYTFEIHETN